jgi:hypothetical protein
MAVGNDQQFKPGSTQAVSSSEWVLLVLVGDQCHHSSPPGDVVPLLLAACSTMRAVQVVDWISLH